MSSYIDDYTLLKNYSLNDFDQATTGVLAKNTSVWNAVYGTGGVGQTIADLFIDPNWGYKNSTTTTKIQDFRTACQDMRNAKYFMATYIDRTTYSNGVQGLAAEIAKSRAVTSDAEYSSQSARYAALKALVAEASTYYWNNSNLTNRARTYCVEQLGLIVKSDCPNANTSYEFPQYYQAYLNAEPALDGEAAVASALGYNCDGLKYNLDMWNARKLKKAAVLAIDYVKQHEITPVPDDDSYSGEGGSEINNDNIHWFTSDVPDEDLVDAAASVKAAYNFFASGIGGVDGPPSDRVKTRVLNEADQAQFSGNHAITVDDMYEYASKLVAEIKKREISEKIILYKTYWVNMNTVNFGVIAAEKTTAAAQQLKDYITTAEDYLINDDDSIQKLYAQYQQNIVDQIPSTTTGNLWNQRLLDALFSDIHHYGQNVESYGTDLQFDYYNGFYLDDGVNWDAESQKYVNPNKAYPGLLDQEYWALFSILRDKVNTAYQIYLDAGSRVTTANFKTLKAHIRDLKSDSLPYAALYQYFNADHASVNNGVCSSLFTDSDWGIGPSVKDEYDSLVTTIKDLCQQVQDQNFANYTEQEREVKVIHEDNSVTYQDYYAVREGHSEAGTDSYGNPVVADFAREDGEDYEATNANVAHAIEMIDKFLASEDLPALIPLKDKDGNIYTDEDGHTYKTLTDFVEAILEDKLYSDDIINALIGKVFPLICNMLNYKLSDILFLADTHYNPLDMSAFGTVYESWAVDIIIQSGWVDIYLNGQRSSTAANEGFQTITFAQLLTQMGVDIYPALLAKHVDASTFPEVRSALSSAGNWVSPAYAASIAGTTIESHMGTIKGDWMNIDVTTSATTEGDDYYVLAYNPYLYKDWDGDGEIDKDKNGKIKLNLPWGINGDKDRFVEALSCVLGAIEPVVQAIVGGDGVYAETIDATVYGNKYLVADANIHDTAIKFDTAIDFTLNPYGDGGLKRIGAKISLFQDKKVKGVDQPNNPLDIYRNLLGPIFEVLQIPDSEFNLNTSINSNSSARQIANAIVDPIQHLIDQITASPLKKILNILPTVIYYFSYDLVTPLIEGIKVNITLTDVANIELLKLYGIERGDSIAGWDYGSWILDTLASFINGKIPSSISVVDLNVDDKLNLNELLNIEDFSDIQQILERFLGESENELIQAVIRNLNDIGIRVDLLSSLGTLKMEESIRTVDSWYNAKVDSSGRGHRYYIKADLNDVFYELLHFLGRVVTCGDLRSTLFNALELNQNELVNSLLANMPTRTGDDVARNDAIADALITAATGASKGYAGDIIKAYDRISEIIRDPTDQLRGDLEDAELARTSTADLLAMWRALDN